MKLIRNSADVTFFLAAFATGCNFYSDETHFVEIEQKNIQATVTLNDELDNDTLWVYQPTSFRYTILVSSGAVQRSEVVLGDRTIGGGQSTGSFALDLFSLKTGFQKLTIRYTLRSGTGSLADRLNLETKEVWRNWVLAIDVDPPPAPALRLSEQNGFLKLSWDPYKRKNFHKYVLSFWPDYSGSGRLEITDPNQTSFVDSAYVGQFARTYSLETHTFLHSGSNVITQPASAFTVMHEYQPEDSMAVIRWSRPKFPGAVVRFQISQRNETIAFSSNNTDTVIRAKLRNVIFGRGEQLQLEVVNRVKSEINPIFVFFIPNPIGKLVVPDDVFFFSQVLNGFVGYSPMRTKLRIYDSGLQLRDSITVPIGSVVPYPGNYLFAATKGGVFHLNLANRQSQVFPLSASEPAEISPFSVSGANDLTYTYSVFRNGFISMAVMDGKTGTTIFGPRFVSIDTREFELSSSGRFFSWYNQLYEIGTNGTANSIGFLAPNSKIRPDNNEEMIAFWPAITITSVPDRTRVRQVNFPESGYYVISYDPFTKHVLCAKSNSNRHYLINIDTGVTRKIELFFDHYTNYVLVNGVVMNPRSGQTMKVL